MDGLEFVPLPLQAGVIGLCHCTLLIPLFLVILIIYFLVITSTSLVYCVFKSSLLGPDSMCECVCLELPLWIGEPPRKLVPGED